MNRNIICAAVLACASPLALAGGQGLKVNANSQAFAATQSEAGAVAAPHQSITYNNPGTVDYSGEYRVRSAPALAIGGPASGPCNGFSAGVGISGMGFGVVGNMSKVDEGCEERETARIAALMGRMDIANLVLEEMEVVKRAKQRREEAQKQAGAKKAQAEQPQRVAQAQPQLVAASTQITPSEQTAAICEQARRTGDTILANRLSCPK